jgi:thiamine pyrophosphate-dependent acetolactate synthase large subunit-like protein
MTQPSTVGTDSASSRMPLLAALEVLRDVRRDEIVVTTMGSAREWPKLSQHPLDFQFLPSAMGHSPMLGLGLALAQPQREVIAFNGDGGMLMGLGSLVSIVASGAKNLTVIVLDNGLYEVTGGQATAGVAARCDFTGMAVAAGFPSVSRYDGLEAWRAAAGKLLQQPGPRFVQLRIEPVGAEYHLPAPTPIVDRIAKFRATLGVS